MDQLYKNLCSGTYVICMIKQCAALTPSALSTLPFLSLNPWYGIVVWGRASKGYLERVLLEQKKTVICLRDLNHPDTCEETFKEQNISRVVSLNIREVMLHISTTKTQCSKSAIPDPLMTSQYHNTTWSYLNRNQVAKAPSTLTIYLNTSRINAQATSRGN